jgi:integrase
MWVFLWVFSPVTTSDQTKGKTMLTETACRNLKPKPAPYKKSDSGGLRLLIQPTGSKLWQLAYRFAGKQKTLAIGPYPVVTLGAAREKRDDAKRALSENNDPGVLKQEAKRERAAAQSFGDWADDWLEKEEAAKKDDKTLAGHKRYVRYLKAEFGSDLVPAIKRAEVLEYLRKLEKTGKLATVSRVRSTGEQICIYADVDGTDHNPFRFSKQQLKQQLMVYKAAPRPALTDPDEVAELFKTIALPFEGAGPFADLIGYAVRFTSLTAVRPGEIDNAEWEEFKIAGRWEIPAEKMKMKHDHIVPLSRQAIALLEEVRALTGDRKYVFSCSRDKPLSDNTLNRRLRNLGYDTRKQHCAHGFRTTFSTLLNGECDRDDNKKWDGDLIELQLAHLDESSVKAIYNRTGAMSLFEARAKMMQHWADRIDTMRDGNVVAITAPTAKPKKVA